MPPPKARLHKATGKARPGSQNTAAECATNTSHQQPSSEAPPVSLTPEQELQFQTELYWCIKQLQTALASGKLPNKQIQEHTKALNTLMSHSASIIKKRQVMRLSFGDYRTKMLEEEKKAKKISIKVGESKPNDKSVFLRKALSNSSGFKFDFPSPENDGNEDLTREEGSATDTTPTPVKIPTNIAFSKSDNSFRFKFSEAS